MSHKHLLLWAVLAILTIAVLSIGRLGESPAMPRHQAATPHDRSVAAAESAGTLAERVELARDERPESAAGVGVGRLDYAKLGSAREFLACYWGDAWPDVLAELEAAGHSVDEMDISWLEPWELAEPRILDNLIEAYSSNLEGLRRRFLAWGYEQNPDVLARHFGAEGLADEHVRKVFEVAEPFHTEIDSVVRVYQDALMWTVVNEFRLGTFPAHPIIFPHDTLGTEPIDVGDALAARSMGVDGWTLFVHLDRQVHPEFDSWLLEIERLGLLRDEAVRNYLASL